MEDKKSMEVATDQNEGYEFDEGIEPTPEEIAEAKNRQNRRYNHGNL